MECSVDTKVEQSTCGESGGGDRCDQVYPATDLGRNRLVNMNGQIETVLV